MNELKSIEQAALACMAKVSFTPGQLIMMFGMALLAGAMIGVLGTLWFGRKS